MKSLILFSFVFLTIVSLSFQPLRAQAPIPNGDFEQWANGSPVGWATDNAATTYTPVTQTSDAEHGSSALLGSVISLGGFGELAPTAECGTAGAPGFPYTDRPNSLTGYYKFNPMGGDTIEILCVFEKNGVDIGGGGFFAATSASSYTAFAVPVEWLTNDTPDTAILAVAIVSGASGLTGSVGSTMEVDNLAFSNQIVGGNAVAPSLASSFDLGQNYPNPLANAISTSIRYSLDEPGYTTLIVYDINGRIVGTPVQEVQSAGNHLVTLDCSGFPTGIYTYRLTCGDHSSAKMMQILH